MTTAANGAATGYSCNSTIENGCRRGSVTAPAAPHVACTKVTTMARLSGRAEPFL